MKKLPPTVIAAIIAAISSIIVALITTFGAILLTENRLNQAQKAASEIKERLSTKLEWKDLKLDERSFTTPKEVSAKYIKPQYALIGGQFVTLRGHVSTMTSGVSVIGALPREFCPDTQTEVPVIAYANSGAPRATQLVIEVSGEIKAPELAFNTIGGVSLDSVIFPLSRTSATSSTK